MKFVNKLIKRKLKLETYIIKTFLSKNVKHLNLDLFLCETPTVLLLQYRI